jgi:thioredoxin
MKSFPWLAIAAISCLPSCDKVRNMAAKFGKSSHPPTAAAAPHTGPLVSQISAADFDSFSRQPGRVVVIDFYADWCGPCRKLAPILDQIAAEHGGSVLIGKINVDQAPELATREGVQGIPDVRIFRDGKPVDKFVGLPPESEVRERIASHTKGLPSPQAATAEPAATTPAEPPIQPMKKDWLPQGIQRR